MLGEVLYCITGSAEALTLHCALHSVARSLCATHPSHSGFTHSESVTSSSSQSIFMSLVKGPSRDCYALAGGKECFASSLMMMSFK